MKRKLSYLAATLLVGHSQNALASDWVAEANVVAIEPFYRPGSLNFMIGLLAHVRRAWLHWQARGASEAAQIANVQAVLSIVQTAKAAGTKVRVYGSNSTGNVDFIHAL
jgi:hypothetical protein